jgi:hypothetical protein
MPALDGNLELGLSFFLASPLIRSDIRLPDRIDSERRLDARIMMSRRRKKRRQAVGADGMNIVSHGDRFSVGRKHGSAKK